MRADFQGNIMDMKHHYSHQLIATDGSAPGRSALAWRQGICVSVTIMIVHISRIYTVTT